ncbi:AAA family ATPase [Glutamicibacter sp.]|uniref:AAA family ATPase n=1 Tax=Glutamicibacter sp. TaxID=1931995 RepID=UPI002B45F53E|nr:AAA family ATPase [Glutamicibacter sp.]HJX79389.1 AAA family ATPase [Glutamicibacter sp.]
MCVQNFRLLRDVSVRLDASSTVVVGRNNSGKTSLGEVVKRIFGSGNATFHIEDFSSSSWQIFQDAITAYEPSGDNTKILVTLPRVEIRFHLDYSDDADDYGPLAPFIIDLDDTRTDALIVISYELASANLGRFFTGLTAPLTKEDRAGFFKELNHRITQNYRRRVWAEDTQDATNIRHLDFTAVEKVIQIGHVGAQRGLDDITTKDSDVLAKVMERLFNTSITDGESAESTTSNLVDQALMDVHKQIDDNFNQNLTALEPIFELFGFPGAAGTRIATKTTLNVQNMLSNYTKVSYPNEQGPALPEAYNGLGTRNMLHILLQIVGHHRKWIQDGNEAGLQLVFIEEPEAHLHPQMQEIFIRQLGEIVKKLSADSTTPWPVQFVVSTHSSHIANAVPFKAIRYFLDRHETNGIRETSVKDLQHAAEKNREIDSQFLHQYLTLTSSDLFFADKAILIEGTTEHLIVPKLIAEMSGPARTNYVTILEVGGAYAHKFFPLLDFLELKSLVVTDLDAVALSDAHRWVASTVHEAGATSNEALKHWFGSDPRLTPARLLALEFGEKVTLRRRVAFQIPESKDGPCGRTFEDAFILANAPLFELEAAGPDDQETAAREQAIKYKKTDFALKFAVDQLDWVTPRYLKEGLEWLFDSTADSERVITNAPRSQNDPSSDMELVDEH